jgi:lipid-A-disaccharide synthase
MKPKQFMLIAGEASGDAHAADLVKALRRQFDQAGPVITPDYQPLHGSFEPRFFGAGGARMAAAGVDLAFDMTAHSVVGLIEPLKNYLKFRRLFRQLYRLALDRQPEAIICVDLRSGMDWFHAWNPKIIQYVSPQVWASRQGRAYHLARDFDLLLCTLLFEKEWYAKRVPKLRVEFVGHPLADRYQSITERAPTRPAANSSHELLLLPGSRKAELLHHVPVMIEAVGLIRKTIPALRTRMVLPNQTLLQQAKTLNLPTDIEIQCGGLAEALSQASVAIIKSGTITLDCAYFGVPAVVMYKTSAPTYLIARPFVKVSHIAMPNLLAKDEVFPEFVQNAVTSERIAAAALQLLQDDALRAKTKVRLAEIVSSLGPPGASRRAANLVLELLRTQTLRPV